MLNDGHVPGRKPAIHDGFHRSIHTDLSNGGGSACSCGKGPGGPSLDRTCLRVKRRAVDGHCCPLCWGHMTLGHGCWRSRPSRTETRWQHGSVLTAWVKTAYGYFLLVNGFFEGPRTWSADHQPRISEAWFSSGFRIEQPARQSAHRVATTPTGHWKSVEQTTCRVGFLDCGIKREEGRFLMALVAVNLCS